MGIAELLDKQIDLREWFADRGVRMSERSFAAYFSDAGTLLMSNESEELTLMEAIILLYQRGRTVDKQGE